MEKAYKNYIKILLYAGLVLLFFSVLPTTTYAATLYFSPSSEAYTTGSVFTVGVYVSSSDQAINAAFGVISFPQDKLEVISLSKSGSIFSLWVQEPSFSNALGTINFEGIMLNPGFIGASGKIISITFKAKDAGISTLAFSSGLVLANDGKGTNVLVGMGKSNYILTESFVPSIKVPNKPEITSSTHPEQDKWYSNSTIKFFWILPKDVTDVSILFNQKPISNPGPLSDGLFSSKTYDNVSDGAWYLHLKFKNKYGWSPIDHFKILIDTTSLLPLDIKNKDNKADEESLFAYFNISGIKINYVVVSIFLIGIIGIIIFGSRWFGRRQRLFGRRRKRD